MATKTSKFGISKREGHDARSFYGRNLYGKGRAGVEGELIGEAASAPMAPTSTPSLGVSPSFGTPLEEGAWIDQIYCHSSDAMIHLPDQSISLAFTSPPYNVGKEYDDDMDLARYLALIERVGREVYRVLKPGGRFVINIANLGRKPYIPLHAHFYDLHHRIGFLAMGEIIWRKGKGANGNCAWGSWMSAKSPRLRDIHEYLLVFAKQSFSRPDQGESDIARDAFMEATLSVWEIPPESANRVGHPAPFPIALAKRVIHLFSYRQDVVLDPFNGSGTTCVAAAQAGRHYVGYDISEEYCQLARQRVAGGEGRGASQPPPEVIATTPPSPIKA